MNKEIKKSIKKIKKYIISQKELSVSRDVYKSNFSNGALFENRIIICSSIRQSGTTTAVAEMFDINKDVYVTTSYALATSFQKYLYEQNKVGSTSKPTYKYFLLKPDYNYISASTINSLNKKLEKSISQTHVINDPSMTRTRGISLSIDATIWIDLGNGISIKTMPKIIDFIHIIDSLNCAGHSSARYIIL